MLYYRAGKVQMTTAQKPQTHTLPISPFSTLGPKTKTKVCGLLKDTREESLEQITRLEIQVNYYWWGLNKDADVVLWFYEAFTSLLSSVTNIVIILSAWQYKYYNSHFARCSVSFEKTLHNKHKFNLKKWWLKQLYIIIVFLKVQ